jgi:Tol biopolymer transport system component
MSIKKRLVILFFLFVFLSQSSAQSSVITLWKDSAIGAIWNEATHTVAYGKKDVNGYYKIYLSDSLGNNEQPLTYTGWATDRHQWAEEWHPSGDYLFCYIEKTTYAPEAGHTRIPDDAVPGYGGYTDIWLIKRDGSQAWQLTNLANDYNNGIIHGAISRDGSLFAWSQRILAPNIFDLNLAAGAYIMQVADFIDGPTPTLANIRTYQPDSALAANELESISADNTTLSFYSTFQTHNLFNTPIYTLHMNTLQITQLTTESFAQAPTYTPDGGHFVYMTGKDCDIFPFEIQGADWYIMDTLGNNKNRITRMNVTNDPQSVNHYRLAGSISFMGPRTFLGGVMTQPLGLTGHTVKVEISENIGLNENTEPGFYFYPNPTAETLTVHLNKNGQNETIEIYNSYGELVKEKELEETTLIDITNLSSGIYFLHLQSNPGQLQKFIKR